MTITFTSYYDNVDSYTKLSIEKKDNKVSVLVSQYDLKSDLLGESLTILDKNQLSEFIGALLHIQSKMRK